MNPDALKDKVTEAARSLGISFNEAFHRLVLERFLARLAISPHQSRFIIKGGFLLSRYVELGRETRDLDFLLQNMHTERGNLQRALSEISAINAGDGFLFTLVDIAVLPHEHMRYGGFRAKFGVQISKMREYLEIDIGIGDVVAARSEVLKLMTGKGKPLFEDEISLNVYPPETILAEKLQTLVLRAEQNSRMKDYYDILMLMRFEKCSGEKAKAAIITTFKHRDTRLELLPVQFSEDDIVILQKHWSVFFRALRKKEGVPALVKDVVDTINKWLQKIGVG
jgi:predicted nucleotidyltransferase component of viral defense system